MKPLTHRELLEVHSAAVNLGIDRRALLEGIPERLVAGIQHLSSPAAQILADLNALNRVQHLADGSSPLGIWLMNAQQLSSARREAATFGRYLRNCEDREIGSCCAQPDSLTQPGPPCPRQVDQAQAPVRRTGCLTLFLQLIALFTATFVLVSAIDAPTARLLVILAAFTFLVVIGRTKEAKQLLRRFNGVRSVGGSSTIVLATGSLIVVAISIGVMHPACFGQAQHAPSSAESSLDDPAGSNASHAVPSARTTGATLQRAPLSRSDQSTHSDALFRCTLSIACLHDQPSICFAGPQSLEVVEGQRPAKPRQVLTLASVTNDCDEPVMVRFQMSSDPPGITDNSIRAIERQRHYIRADESDSFSPTFFEKPPPGDFEVIYKVDVPEDPSVQPVWARWKGHFYDIE